MYFLNYRKNIHSLKYWYLSFLSGPCAVRKLAGCPNELRLVLSTDSYDLAALRHDIRQLLQYDCGVTSARSFATIWDTMLWSTALITDSVDSRSHHCAHGKLSRTRWSFEEYGCGTGRCRLDMSELSDQLFCQLNFSSTIFAGRPKRPDLCSCQRWLCSAWYQTCLCVADYAQLVLAVSAFRRSICSSQKRQVTGTSVCRPNQAMWTFCRLDRFIIDGAPHCRFFLPDYYTVDLLWKK